MRRTSTTICMLLGAALFNTNITAAASDAPNDDIILREALVIDRVGSAGRLPVHTDAIQAMIVSGRWTAPAAGQSVALPDGSTRTWAAVTAAENGIFKHDALSGGYVFATVRVDSPRIMILDAAGHNMVYVNGEPRVGDPYSYGFVRLPVALRAGDNELLFHVSRGSLRAALRSPRNPIMLDSSDSTLPDIVIGEEGDQWGALIVTNATETKANNLVIETMRSDGARPAMSRVPPIPPLSVRKVAFPIRGPATNASGPIGLTIRLLIENGSEQTLLDSAQVELQRRRSDAIHKRTFVSEIDGSVQYYVVVPPKSTLTGAPPALILTLHGASVQASGHAACYAQKDWAFIVAPTNRRPFGFDWEDWGRLDALEVLDLAQSTLDVDPLRTYLTGHSMGGHGTWQLGATFPDRFAAIGPSAGWRDFWSYTGAARFENPDPVESMLARATNPSNTLNLARNLLHFGIYVLHGDADDNVPVAQARDMRSQLGEFHPDFVYYERKGAGHWWDDDDKTTGTSCVDWRPMFEFFKDRTLPPASQISHVEFATANPGISASCHWATIEAQIEPLTPSSIDVTWTAGTRHLMCATANVARLSIDLGAFAGAAPVIIDVDDLVLVDVTAIAPANRIWLYFDDGRWTQIDQPSPSLKGPHRCGPFKDAFRHHMMLVYGTQGTAEENAWAMNKARYDAEAFWYRGNGSIDIVADRDFNASVERDRGVILYGNADTNAAWGMLLGDSPVQARRGGITIGQHRFDTDDLACLFIQPRKDSDAASVGVVTGSGIRGMRLTERLPYFVSGVAYPDFVVIGPEALAAGSKGVRAAGFFDQDWAVDETSSAWRDAADSP